MKIIIKKIISILAVLTVVFGVVCPASALSKPKAPRLKSVSNTAGGVRLKWTASKNAEKYFVYRKTSSSKFKKIATAKKTTYLNKSAKSGTKYTYRICAVNSGGNSKPSNTKSIFRIGIPKLTTTNTDYAIKLSWSSIGKATKYVLIYKKANAKKYKLLYSGKKRSYMFYDMTPGAVYKFEVRAVIGKRAGLYCAPKKQMFIQRTSASADEPLNMKGIDVIWNPVSHAKGYILYRAPKNSNTFKRIAATSKTHYLDPRSNLKSISTYKYYVVACNGSYRSARSNITSEVFGYLQNANTPLTLSIKKGEVYKDIYNKLNQYGAVKYITWKSLKSSVAKVTTKGVITGVKKGTAALKATVDPSLFAIYGHPEVTTPKVITINVTVT